MVPTVTPTSIWAWPDPAVLLNLTSYMTGALAHLASLRQPLAAILVSLSAQSSPAPRTAEVVDFPLSPNSVCTPPFFWHPQISVFFCFFSFLSPIHTPVDSRPSPPQGKPLITFLLAISSTPTFPYPTQWPDRETEGKKKEGKYDKIGEGMKRKSWNKTYTHKDLIKWSFKCVNG